MSGATVVVIHDLESRSVVAGVPAYVIRTRIKMRDYV